MRQRFEVDGIPVDVALLAVEAWHADPGDGMPPDEVWWDSTKDAWLDGFETGYKVSADEIERLQADNQRMAKVYELAARSAHAASLFQGGAGGRDNPHAVAVHMAEWFEEQEAEVVRLQQALRDLLEADSAAAKDDLSFGEWSRRQHEKRLAVDAAGAVLNGDQQ